MNRSKFGEVHVVGVPMDLGASRRGTDMGPSALRVAGLARELRGMGLKVARERDVQVPAQETRVEPTPGTLRYKDEILHVCTRLAGRVERILDGGGVPLVLGGDHSIAMGTVAGVAGHFRSRKERVGLVWIDAHADMNTPETSPSGNVHGMPLSHLLGLGDPDLAGIGGFAPKVRPENVALIGIRDVDEEERNVVRDSGVHVWTMREIDEKGMARVAREALEVLNDGTAGFHVSWDVDGLDPSVVAGVGTPVPGGIGYREAHLLFETFADDGRMTSMEVVELNPLLDHRNQGARTVVHLVMSAFGLRIL